MQPGETKGRTIKFYKNKVKSVWGTIVGDWAHRNEFRGTSNEIIEVPVVDFLDSLKRYGIPHYMKIDIEGMDTVCLKALMSFEQKPAYVSIESEKISFEKLIEELHLLTRLGYEKFKAIQQFGIQNQAEPHPSKEGCYVGYQFQKGSSGLFGEDLPGEWKDYKKIVRQYKSIFLQYRLFGDFGILRGHFIGKVLHKVLTRYLRKPIPGWYDTHAKHSTIVS